jgi:hypothetical protein
VQTTEGGKPHLTCLSSRPFTKAALEGFFAARTVLPLTVVSDGLACFTVAESLGAVHDREVTGGGKASVLNEKFQAVNTLIGNLKTALTGTYHAVKFAKYAYRYLAEAQFRFNRRYDLRAILGSLVRAVVATQSSQSAASGLLRFIANQDSACRARAVRRSCRGRCPSAFSALSSKPMWTCRFRLLRRPRLSRGLIQGLR